MAGREKKLLGRERKDGVSRSTEGRLLRVVAGRIEGVEGLGSVGWPNTKPLAAAAMAVPVPTSCSKKANQINHVRNRRKREGERGSECMEKV